MNVVLNISISAICPRCGISLLVRTRRDGSGAFLGCPNYKADRTGCNITCAIPEGSALTLNGTMQSAPLPVPGPVPVAAPGVTTVPVRPLPPAGPFDAPREAPPVPPVALATTRPWRQELRAWGVVPVWEVEACILNFLLGTRPGRKGATLEAIKQHCMKELGCWHASPYDVLKRMAADGTVFRNTPRGGYWSARSFEEEDTGDDAQRDTA